MEKSKTSNRYSPEMRARAVHMVLEHQGSYETRSAAVAAIAPKIGCIPETLKVWVRQAEHDSGARDGASCHIGASRVAWKHCDSMRSSNKVNNAGDRNAEVLSLAACEKSP